MVAEKKKHLHLFSGIFEPTVDFFDLLNKQADKVLEGWQALLVWLKEDGEEGGLKVKELERQADELKMDLERKLVSSFVTPFDREDIYELSSCLDEVINTSKAVVREMQAMGVRPHGTKLVEMAELLIEGVVSLQNSIRALKSDLKLAADQALLSRKTDSRFAKLYRPAMAELLEQDDFKQIFRVREVYKVMVDGAERIDRVGECLLHAIVKMS